MSGWRSRGGLRLLAKAPFAKGAPGEAGWGFSPSVVHFGRGKPSVIRFADATSFAKGGFFPLSTTPGKEEKLDVSIHLLEMGGTAPKKTVRPTVGDYFLPRACLKNSEG